MPPTKSSTTTSTESLGVHQTNSDSVGVSLPDNAAELLPESPSRGNSPGNTPFEQGEPDPSLPDHIIPCETPNHDGVCEVCNFWITIGSSGREYGHARGNNRDKEIRDEYGACHHRPLECDPGNNFEGRTPADRGKDEPA